MRYSNHFIPDVDNDSPVNIELYDLENDAVENYNVAKMHPEIANRLMNLLSEKAKEVDAKIFDE